MKPGLRKVAALILAYGDNVWWWRIVRVYRFG